GGYGGGQGGQRSGGYGGGQGGQRSGGYGGGRPGGRSNAPVMNVAAKPVSPASKAKEKEKERERTRADFPRDRREQFNENKLMRNGKRRAGQQEARKPEFPTTITVEGPMTVGEFAKLLKREPSEVIKKLLFLGIVATINQDIDTDAMELIADEFGVKMTVVEPVDEEALDMLIEEDKPQDLVPRPPVVTIMGHVDHGKTTLLDAIRQSRITATESGGITQHIGAYQVEVQGRRITFLDTPGHEAFTTMRARGAQVTDVTILVVAADDGVMPQTVEAINHAKAANVPIIVAVNKIDKPDANPDRIKQELTQHGLVAEEWGGDTIFVNISALKKQGLDTLLEMVLLVADLQELKANPKARPRGTVIEAKLDKGRGPVATILVQNGTLKVGDIVVAGQTYGRVRAMVNDVGRRLKEAGPSTPVEILGLNEVPSAGDLFVVYDDERAARHLVEKRQSRDKVQQQQNTSRVTLDDLYRHIQEGNVKELNVIVKADVQGSVEALVQAIEKIEVEGVRVNVIHRGAGAITESDVLLASTSNAIIIGFHVRPDANAARAAEAEKVDIRLYRVIYNVIEEIESAMKGMLDPTYKEVVIGHAEVRQTFHISKVGTVAGCYVTDGKITRDAECRVIRDGVVVYEGKLDTLKRFKDDAREVAQGFECGLTLEKYNDIKIGDIVEAFKMEAVKPN
ncbi:translation initiation factor IF-2, partial [Alicyclobacillus pomorum]